MYTYYKGLCFVKVLYTVFGNLKYLGLWVLFRSSTCL